MDGSLLAWQCTMHKSSWAFELKCIRNSKVVWRIHFRNHAFNIWLPLKRSTNTKNEPKLNRYEAILWCLWCSHHHKSNSVAQINSISISQSFKRYLNSHCLKYYLLNVAAFCLQYFIGFSFIVLPLVPHTNTLPIYW